MQKLDEEVKSESVMAMYKIYNWNLEGIIRPHLQSKLFYIDDTKNTTSIGKILNQLHTEVKTRQPRDIIELKALPKILNLPAEVSLEERTEKTEEWY